MKTTQLYAYHSKHAKLTEFAGYEMPLWYTTTTEEHLAVRNQCGVFDVSHMGRFVVRGPSASGFLEELVPTHVKSQPPGKAFYTLLLNEQAGIVDDLIIIKRSETDYIVVVNAANSEGDMAHFKRHLPSEGVEIDNVTQKSVMIAVQGPHSSAVLQPLTPYDLNQLKRFRSVSTEILHQPSVISRTGYTGEDGFEAIMMEVTSDEPRKALEVWERLVTASKACGLAARDSLRLEAGFPLHGSDIDQQTNPFQADLAWVVAEDKQGYVGHKAVAGLRQTPPDTLRRGVVLDKGIPRHDFEIFDSAMGFIGRVTSGTFSPILRRGIALCRIMGKDSSPGERIKMKIRDSTEDGKVVKTPFYDETVFGWKRTAKG
jgi:aminomethyltransferase